MRAPRTPSGGRRAAASAASGLLAVLAVAGCGSSSSPTATSPTTAVVAPSTASAPTTAAAATTTVPTLPTSSSTVTPTTGTASVAAQNLVVTDGLRSELVDTATAAAGLPAGSYTGLIPGLTYYAFDPTTDTYWAGAGVLPSSTSEPAQVSVQDDGAYLLFMRVGAEGTWTVKDVGLAGTDGSTCPETVPAGVLAVWGWAPGTCHAPGT